MIQFLLSGAVDHKEFVHCQPCNIRRSSVYLHHASHTHGSSDNVLATGTGYGKLLLILGIL